MKHLLLIDDEPAIMTYIQAVAEELDFEVCRANDSTDFVESFKKLSPIAIILDLAMPGTDGIELLRWLASEGCQARIAILSGFDRRVLDAAGRLGEASGLQIIGVLPKPIRLVELRNMLVLLGQGA